MVELEISMVMEAPVEMDMLVEHVKDIVLVVVEVLQKPEIMQQETTIQIMEPNGGDGVQSSLSGTATDYGGGGGGSAGSAHSSSGGLGGGGGCVYGTPNAGTTSTGGGGSGGSSSNTTGQSGGSGIVILKYPNTFTVTENIGGSSAGSMMMVGA